MAVFEATDESADSLRCMLCGGDSSRLFESAGYWIRQCDSCSHQFAELSQYDGHVERVYNDDYFSGGGAGYDDYLNEAPLLISRGRWYARRLAKYCRPGTVLDVGAAAGMTLAGFAQAGWQGNGIEPNAGMADYAQRHYGVCVEQGTLESWVTERKFDLVTMLQVLPHFINPRKAIFQAGELLHPGGHLLVETWNRDSWTARLFGHHWHEYSPPSVLHWFSKDGLSQLAASNGFVPVASGRPSKWINAGHAKSVLRHKAGNSRATRLMLGAATLIPDQVSLPYPSEDLFWMLFRRN